MMRDVAKYSLASDTYSAKLPALERETSKNAGKSMHQGLTIVSEKLLRLGRSTVFRKFLLASTLPFVGVVAAFGIAPDTVTDKIELTRVVEEVALPAIAASDAADETYWREERIQRAGDVAPGIGAEIGRSGEWRVAAVPHSRFLGHGGTTS